MSSIIKERKIYGINNFYGLDTENSKIKIEKYRASDGKNFVIDSGALKTRKGLKYKDTPILKQTLPSGITPKIIDYYYYKDLCIYVLDVGFMIFIDNTKANSTKLITNFTETNGIIKNGENYFNFNGLEPLFIEEKDCLFIYCINDIYVIGQVQDGEEKKAAIYSLKDKPNNVLINDLPNAYVPTLYIGDNKFEDINLLSNKTKYKMFASNSDEDNVTYYLTTAYDREKNGKYGSIVKLYNGLYNHIPYYMGKQNENFNEEITDYGAILNDTSPINVGGNYKCKNTYIYSRNGEVDTPISEILGLTKDEFFSLYTKSNQNIYDYTISYIKANESTFVDENKVLKFTINYRVMVQYKDSSSGVLLEEVEEWRNSYIYVQLLNLTDKKLMNEEIKSSSPEIELTTSNPPTIAYPTFDSTPNISEYITSGNEYLDVLAIGTSTFKDIVDNYIQNNYDTIFSNPSAIDNNYIAFYGRLSSQLRDGYTTYQAYAIKYKINSIYSINFNETYHRFEINMKNMMYSKIKEPVIEVEIEYENNPDYDMIVKNKFGITFGSENRLFLAGNEEYKNIDRYNVSNDLLGENVKSQSYELTYFPSKNYRVVGGKGAINGYVVTTDTQLYITKEEYANDQKLYIRNRVLDDNGIVGYNEYKTSIDKTPINNKCIVRYYNDIVMLNKSGLYGIEISNNVLTDERLIKNRSSYINGTLINEIANYNGKIFIYEDNHYMYIVIGKKWYVADNRYSSKNPNGEIENYSYEFVRFEMPFEISNIKKVKDEILVLDKDGKNIYVYMKSNKDDISIYLKSAIMNYNFDGKDTTYFSGISGYLVDDKNNYTINTSVYKLIAKETTDYNIDGNNINIVNFYRFRMLNKDMKIYYKVSDEFVYSKVKTIEEEYIVLKDENGDEVELTNVDELYIDVKDTKLYPKIIFTDIDTYKKTILSPYKTDTIEYLTKGATETQNEYYERISALDDDYCKYEFGINDLKDVLVQKSESIELIWVSGTLDFGYNIYEKTLFKTNIYASKQDKENEIKFGYKTMRRYDRIEEMKTIDSSNANNYDQTNYSLYAINTFNEFGASFPTKENNFLYIVIMIVGYGDIQVNEMNMLYKNNRSIKTIS